MQDNREITNEEVQKASEIINNLLSYYNSKVVGQPYLGYSLLVAMIWNPFQDLPRPLLPGL